MMMSFGCTGPMGAPMDEGPFGHASGFLWSSGRPEPDVSTWEGRMSMRAQFRKEMAALTEPPPDDTEYRVTGDDFAITGFEDGEYVWPAELPNYRMQFPSAAREAVSVQLPSWAGQPLTADWEPEDGERIDITEAVSLELDDNAVRFDYKHPVIPLNVWGRVCIYAELSGQGPYLIASWRMYRTPMPEDETDG
jgi:hypothetical protein